MRYLSHKGSNTGKVKSSSRLKFQKPVHVAPAPRARPTQGQLLRTSGVSGLLVGKDRWVAHRARELQLALQGPKPQTTHRPITGVLRPTPPVDSARDLRGVFADATTARMARQATRKLRIIWSLNVENPDALRNLSDVRASRRVQSGLCQVESSQQCRPALVWSESRKSHNRRMHALVGNGAGADGSVADFSRDEHGLPLEPLGRAPFVKSRKEHNKEAHALHGNTTPFMLSQGPPELEYTQSLLPESPKRRRLSNKSGGGSSPLLAPGAGLAAAHRPVGLPRLAQSGGAPSSSGGPGVSSTTGVTPGEAAAGSQQTGPPVARTLRELDASTTVEGEAVDTIHQIFADLDLAVTDHVVVDPQPAVNDYSIPDVVTTLLARVRGAYPQWPERQALLAAGALCVEPMRPQAVCTHEEIQVLYLIESQRNLRAHNGVAYIYDPVGAWLPYSGLVPPSSLHRVKIFLLQLEGLFRALPPTTARVETAILAGVHDYFLQAARPVEDVLLHLQRAAQSYISRGRRRPHAGGEGGEDDDAPPNLSGWLETAAFTSQRLGSAITNGLMGDRLLKYFVEWCDTPRPTTSGVAFHDTTLVFDEQGRPARHVERGPAQNIYLHIPHPLLQSMDDPVLDAAMQRVKRFYAQTFYKNGPAFQCSLSALALALKGHNVDRCFWGIGPGGVGQSLFTAHLAALLGRLHAYLDTNIYYTEDEMRKQADQLVNCVVVTGQESVEGSSRRLREDLYKKHMSGDPVPARMPYAILTKQVELLGWKRMELNSVPRFQGVTERNFDSISRRGLVVTYRAQFRDAEWLRTNGHRLPPGSGVFPRDPSLRAFLRSGPAIACTLRMLRGFLYTRSYQDCVDILEAYAERGGDGGLTRMTMRAACGLAELIVTEAPTVVASEPGGGHGDSDVQAGAAPLRTPVFDPMIEAREDQERKLSSLLSALVQQDAELLTRDLIQRGIVRAPWILALKRQVRYPEVEALLRAAGWKHILVRAQRRDLWVPRIPVRQGLAKVGFGGEGE